MTCTKIRSTRWPRPAMATNADPADLRQHVAPATISPRDLNAPGNAADGTRLTGIRTMSMSRTGIRRASSQFVAQVALPQNRHGAATRSGACARFCEQTGVRQADVERLET